MSHARLAPLAMTLLAAAGCMMHPAQGTIAGVPLARVDRLALLLPPDDGSRRQVAWDYARLTVGRHDAAGALYVRAFATLRDGAGQGVVDGGGAMPAFKPGSGYWLRVELMRKQLDRSEAVVGLGGQGEDDAQGVVLVPGGNLAQVPVAPTAADAVLLAAPIAPPWTPPPTPSPTPVPVPSASVDWAGTGAAAAELVVAIGRLAAPAQPAATPYIPGLTRAAGPSPTPAPRRGTK